MCPDWLSADLADITMRNAGIEEGISVTLHLHLCLSCGALSKGQTVNKANEQTRGRHLRSGQHTRLELI